MIQFRTMPRILRAHRTAFGTGVIRTLVTTLCAVMFSASVSAEEALIPADPWELIHTARDFGPAEVGRDDMKDPMIRGALADEDGALSGLTYTVAFYGCYLGRDCKTVLFATRLRDGAWEEEPLEAERLAEWNREKLFGRAWLDEAGQAVLEHPVSMAGGLPEATLAATFEAWIAAVRGYADYLDISEP